MTPSGRGPDASIPNARRLSSGANRIVVAVISARVARASGGFPTCICTTLRYCGAVPETMVAARFAEILYLAVREAIERMPDARIERATDARPRCSRNTRRATGRFMGACRNGTVRTFQHGAPGPSRRSGRSSVRDYRSERRRHRRVLDAAQVSEYRRSCCAHPPRFEAVD